MAHSPVTWQYRDPITYSKLAQMVENVKAHDHRADGSQGGARGAWAMGVFELVHGAAGVVSQTITFPTGRFSAAPNVAVTLMNPVAAHEGRGVRNVTATSCVIWAGRTNAGSNWIMWVAREAF